MKKLKKLLKDIPNCLVKGAKDISITGMSSNSKLIAPGNLFIAKKGKTFDGSQFIQEAIKAGASAIATDLYDPSLKQITQIIHPHISSIEPALAANYYEHPSRELFMMGITGTNGKTTTSFIVKNLLDFFKGPCGLIGTIEYIVGEHRYEATRTTPDVITNHKMLREMVVQGCSSAVMEVSSHALDQGRVDLIDFDIAIFSNLTLEHLDYHGTMEEYGNAKRKLFQQLGKNKKDAWAIVNQDSSWTPHILKGCSTRIFSYGIEQMADLKASHIQLEGNGTRAKITYQGQSMDCHFPLVGRFNVYNCLAAMAVALSQNLSLEQVTDYMSKVPFVRGRLQLVNNCLGLQIYVDFAHTDDAILNVLTTLKEIQKPSGRLIVVFGCGGDRDRSKRSKMAQVCEHYADCCIVTSDNPRSEDPKAIIDEIIKGFSNSALYQIEIDRKVAIQKAIEIARSDDILLIAGKGHETYQVFAHKTIEFDDCKVAAEACAHLMQASHMTHN